jgi:hypothetical protein
MSWNSAYYGIFNLTIGFKNIIDLSAKLRLCTAKNIPERKGLI